MATVTKKVYPLGGGDYTSVASALGLAPHNAGDDLVLLCGPGNIGAISVSGFTYNSVTVQADTGFRHDGTTSQATSVVASLTSSNVAVNNTGTALILDGILFTKVTVTPIEAYNDGSGGVTNLTVKNCQFRYSSTASNMTTIIADPDGGTVNLTVNNNIFYVIASLAGFIAISAQTIDGIGPSTINLSANFNSGVNNGTQASAVAFVYANAAVDAGGGGTINVSCQNNAFCNSAADYKKSSAIGTINLVAGGHNVSADATSTVFAGTGNLTAKNAATCFKTPASDLHMAIGSPLLVAGVVIGGIVTDNQGKTRPATPSIGALELLGSNPVLGNGSVL